MTADFTIPELAESRPELRHDVVKNKRPRWMNPTLSRRRGGAKVAPPRTGPKKLFANMNLDDEEEAIEAAVTPKPGIEEDVDAVGEPEEEEEDSDSDLIDNDPLAKSKPDDEAEENTDTVQILDLESNNPIMSYKGHTFSMTWAENIGTELLFTARDDSNPLPSLRKLKYSIDLLACSSARLISQPVKLEPKPHTKVLQQQSSSTTTNTTTPRRRTLTNLPIRINLGHKARTEVGPEWRNQAKFLEQLIAIKKLKGEEDEVSIVTQKRLTGGAWKIVIREKKLKELEELHRLNEQDEFVKQKIATLTREIESLGGEDGTARAGKETMQMAGGRKRRIVGDSRAENVKKRGGSGSGVSGVAGDRGRGRVGWGIRGRGADHGSGMGLKSAESMDVDGEGEGDDEIESTSISTLTPVTWDELGK